MRMFNKLTDKQFIAVCLITTELMLIWFFSSIGYFIYRDMLLIYIICGLILMTLTPLFYLLWKNYPCNQKFSLSHNSC